jgi:PKD repeat protein
VVGVPETVTADVLPTVQHNGVAWDSVVVGDKAFVVGAFSSARPAGSALGVNEVPRANILAFDVRTGVLDGSFAPVLDGQALTVEVSPDQSTIYVGGDFQKVDGLWRPGLAAFDVASGALKAWAPVAGSTVRALDVTDSAVYVGGDFQGVSDRAGSALTPRRFVAAFHPVSGAVLGWDPSADAAVTALTVNHSGSKVVVAGRFQNIGGQAWYGMAAVDPVSGAALPWAATATIRNAGTKSSLTSLLATADGVYGTGYVFGAGGNFEGVFRADNESGAIGWLADCHGDHYSAFPLDGVVYTASHAHYCGNIGSFPQTEPWTMYHSGAFTDEARVTIQKEPYGYANYEGKPGPEQLNWYPSWLSGTTTTAKQAAWSVSGNAQYLVYAGEFIGVNGAPQQGLVRFAKKGIAPNKVKPNLNEGLTPSLVSARAGQVRVGWQATHDRDNEAITYKVFRDFTSLTNTPVHQVTVNSLFWRRPGLSFVDTGLTPGRSYSYVVYAFDPLGNRVNGVQSSVVVAGAEAEDAYVNTVLGDSPARYFRLDDPVGATRLAESAGSDRAIPGTGVTLGVAGVHGSAASFNGTATATATQVSQPGPDLFSVEAWFKTTSTTGGHIAGYGTRKTGNSGWMDRMVYLDGAGRVSFGVYAPARGSGSAKAVSSAAGFNDGAWHHVVGTVGPKGLRLYVDAKLVGSRAEATTGRYYSGVWRIGGDNVPSGWPNRPTSMYFTGTIDEVAVYGSALSAAKVAEHYVAGGGTSPLPPPPTDAYGKAVYDLDPDLYWRLDEASGTTATDSGRALNAGTAAGGVSWAAGGGLFEYPGTAASFDGSNDLVVASKPVLGGPRAFTAGLWFKTTTTTGGKLIGFGNTASGLSATYDRHIYMQNDGKLVFGVYSGTQNKITTPVAYNDGAWHQVVATQGPEGMRLYVDGTLVGSHPATTGQAYDGYWRIGGDNTWGSTSKYLKATLDEAMVLDTNLTETQIAAVYRKGSVNRSPVAAFNSVPAGLSVAFDGAASQDPDGSIVSHAWDFGDGLSGSGVMVTHEYAASGSYDVTLTVTDDRGAQKSVVSPVTVVEPPNVDPDAAFDSVATGLSVAFDGAASQDPDGSIVSHSWDFGDGSSGSGETATHEYAASGTYDVTLTVTDNRGGTASTTSPVTVVEPPNQDPAANFSGTQDRLSVAFDGSASQDPDGSIVSHAWDFGDGTTPGSGQSVTHVYATSGTYDVTLTVTDDDGAMASTSKSITVTNNLAADTFTRSVASGWGTADLGGAWSTSTASLFSVADGKGRVSVAASKGPQIHLSGMTGTDLETTAALSVDRAATGGGTYLSVVGRGATNEGYRGKARIMPDGSVQLSLVRLVAGAETTLGTAAMPVSTFSAGDTLKFRLRVSGTLPTSLSLKVWNSTASEPSGWQITASDSTVGLQKPGGVGLAVFLSSSATNGPIVVTMDDVTVAPAQ